MKDRFRYYSQKWRITLLLFKHMVRIFSVETVQKSGETALVKGWVHARRDMGKIVFFDLRDREGLLQVVCVPSELDEASNEALKDIRPEWVLAVEGAIQKRGEKQINPDMPTGTVELLAKRIAVLNQAKTPPFEVDKDTSGVDEELRLRYRYLDLRSERMKQNIKLRHKVNKHIRDFYTTQDFFEIETPILTKSTPEGARDFLVPARKFSGKFYALPQSPQQYKQLLMAAGLERYFQIARCFRDEDTRKDRQPEFTQLDLEMSFVEREDVMAVNEEMLISLVEAVCPDKKITKKPFPRMTYQEAMEKYGTDRPDLRQNKDDKDELAFLWVTDFPFFEKTDEGGWTFTHNPFSAPLPEHREALLKKENIGGIMTTQYDIVLNGFEIGGGSIRNHTAGSLHTVFEILGYTEAQIKAQFGHMLEAFAFGTPPHGGIAFGLDRLIAILAGEYESIREVIAFPKTAEGRDPMMESPSEVDQRQLHDLGIRVR